MNEKHKNSGEVDFEDHEFEDREEQYEKEAEEIEGSLKW